VRSTVPAAGRVQQMDAEMDEKFCSQLFEGETLVNELARVARALEDVIERYAEDLAEDRKNLALLPGYRPPGTDPSSDREPVMTAIEALADRVVELADENREQYYATLAAAGMGKGERGVRWERVGPPPRGDDGAATARNGAAEARLES